MNTAIIIIQIILSVALVILIFLQPSGDLDGRSSNLFSTTVEKRGWEKIMFYLTLSVLFLFLLSSIIQTII